MYNQPTEQTTNKFSIFFKELVSSI